MRESALGGRPAARRPPRPPRRDHRPRRPQDDHQRAQLRRAASSWPTSRTRTRRPGRTSCTASSNLGDAVARHDRATRPPTPASTTALGPRPATLMVRPRGWHLPERHVARRRPAGPGLAVRLRPLLLPQRARRSARGAPARTSTCRSWRATSRRGSGTTSSSPPRSALGIPRGTIKATVLIETLPAAFEMDEILYELREHSAGLNCGRWDYIFSFIKKLRADPACVLPDRAQVTMTAALHARLRAAAHQDLPPPRRARDGRHGGADPDQGRPGAPTRRRSRKVRADKLREVRDGHDGTWVAHPGLVPVAPRDLRRAHARRPTRSTCKREDVQVTAADLLRGARGHAHRGGAAPQRPRRRAVPRGVAAGQRLRAALQPDGGRGHRRDLAHAGVAVAAPRRRARRRPAAHRRALPAASWTRSSRSCARRSGRRATTRGRFAEARSLFERMSTSDDVRRVPDAARPTTS